MPEGLGEHNASFIGDQRHHARVGLVGDAVGEHFLRSAPVTLSSHQRGQRAQAKQQVLHVCAQTRSFRHAHTQAGQAQASKLIPQTHTQTHTRAHTH